MIFNLWRPIWLVSPKKSGWYLCTTAHGGGLYTPLVMDLYFDAIHKTWTNPRRQRVFDGYKVYEACRAPIEDNRVYSDSDCERIDVTAWRKLPKCYGRVKKKRSKRNV